MIHTFDKKVGFVKNYVRSVIPCSEEDYIDDSINCHVLKEFEYPNAGDYKEMSYDEIREYISSFYNDVLSRMDPLEVLYNVRNSILVSDERSDSLAKRHIIGEWLRLFTGEKIWETDIINGKFVPVAKPDFIRPMLEEAIRNSKTNMRGFTSLRALYLFEKGEELEVLADVLEEKNGTSYDDLRQKACYLRCDADEAELAYKRSNESKTLSYAKYRKYPSRNRQIKGQIKWDL